MATVLRTPSVDAMHEVVDSLRAWQLEGEPLQLHPGDVGWFLRFGGDATAAAIRTWSRNGQILAIGLLDGPTLLRFAFAPPALHDEELAREVAADVMRPASGVLGAGPASVEAPMASPLRDLLEREGWQPDELRAPLRRVLDEAVEEPGVRIVVVGPGEASIRSDVQRSAFDRSTFTEERWRAMAAGLPYGDARCLLAYDGSGNAVAAVTVWSAGPGKPGLIEPMGVHREHRGHGYGRAICVAAAAALRELGSSSAMVGTASHNVAAVATYQSAGFQALPEVRDLRREG